MNNNKWVGVWFLCFIYCFSWNQLLTAAENPSVDELKQLHHKYKQDIHRGILLVRYSSTKVVENEKIEEQERFHEDRMVSEIDNIQQSALSAEEKENRIQKSEQNYEYGLYQLQKHFSGRTEAERIYKIDLIDRLFWQQEIPVEADLGGDVLNGAWNRFLLVDDNGHWMECRDDSVVLAPIGANVLDAPIYGGLLYPGIVPSSQFESFSQLAGIREDHFDGRNAFVYELAMPDQPDRKLVIYTDPSIGYRYLKTETLHNGKPSYVQIAKDYKVIDAIPFPMYFENISYDIKTSEVKEREVFQVKEVRLNQPFEPDAFTIEITPKTVISLVSNDPNESKMFRPDPEKSTKLGIREILEQASTAPDYFKVRAQEKR